MKKMLIRVLLPMVVVAGVGLAGVRDAQGQQGCEPGVVCLYEGVRFGGRLWLFSSDASYVGDDVNDRASSVFNDTGAAVVLYSDANFSGFSICVDPGTGIGDLDVVGLNDDVSSLAFFGSC